MVDWSVPQPSYEELHAKVDALQTERNAAVAEAKLWLRRVIAMQQERDQANANLYACSQSLDEWEAAYNDLLRDFRRLEVEANSLRFNYTAAESVVDHLIASRQAAESLAAK